MACSPRGASQRRPRPRRAARARGSATRRTRRAEPFGASAHRPWTPLIAARRNAHGAPDRARPVRRSAARAGRRTSGTAWRYRVPRARCRNRRSAGPWSWPRSARPRELEHVVEHARGRHRHARARTGNYYGVAAISRSRNGELVVGAGQRGEGAADVHANETDVNTRGAHGGTVAQHRVRGARLFESLAPHGIHLLEPRDEIGGRYVAECLRHQRLHLHGFELALEAEQPSEDQGLTCDVHSREVLARIWLGVAGGHRGAQRGGEERPASELAEKIAERARRAPFDAENLVARLLELEDGIDDREPG